jgi:cardiolipin synthase A/B
MLILPFLKRVHILDDLISVIIRMVASTPCEKIIQLGQIVRNLEGSSDTTRLNSWAKTPLLKQQLNNLVECWRLTKVSPDEITGMIVGASYAYHQAKTEESLELVWTGPPSDLVPTRKTEQALLEVINAANKNLFLTCFVTYKATSIFEAIDKAINRGVGISILMESSDKPEDGILVDAITKMKVSFPKAKVYYWDNTEDEFEGGKVHAKIAVADGQVCFISSANLTEYAMEKNMEAGTLIHGGSIPEKLYDHLKALVTKKVVKLT